MADRKLFAGHAVRRLRRQAGLTQAAMAEMLDISASYLNLVERNQRPLSATLLLRLAERFDFDPRALSADEPGGGAEALRRRLADPLFGDLAAFDALVAAAHARGIKIIVDFVPSHTSEQHPWFQASRASRDNPYRDWYVWRDPKPDGSPPNNWAATFGGSSWEWDAQTGQFYLHSFLPEQPDLNFHNREVQDALLDVTRFWLERGVDGFRLDTINFYFHSQGLEDNPALPLEERNDQTAPSVNPYNYQDHLYDKSRPENLAFLERFRALLDE